MSRPTTVRTVIIVVPIAAGILALAVGDAERAWGAYLFNLVFWMGIAAAAPTLSAAIKICNGQWAENVHREARAWMPVLWLTLGLLALLPLGARALYPWATQPVEGLETWLSALPLFGRDLLALFVLAWVAQRFVRDESGRQRWPVLLALAFTAVMTLLAVDLVMSLQPRWVSSLFGTHFFVGAAYGALATFPIAARLRGTQLPADVVHDLGKLLFAFSMLWTYMFWSQYIVTWYGNLPHELSWWMPRVESGWLVVGLFVLFACFAAPFVFLLSRANRRSLRALSTIGALVLVGLWAERSWLVMPSILPEGAPLIGWPEIAVTAAFVAAVAVARGGKGRDDGVALASGARRT